MATMRNPEVFARVISKVPRPIWRSVMPMETLSRIFREGKLKPGDLAPDFNLPTADKQHYVRLSSFRGQKPVVLIFGSYT